MNILSALLVGAAGAAAEIIASDFFRVVIDDVTGALSSLTDPRTNSTRNWIGSSSNTPWQPSSSRWGLGYFDAGTDSLHRHYWTAPATSCSDPSTCTSTYRAGSLTISVQRTTAGRPGTLTESYTFKNTGPEAIDLSGKGAVSLAIFTPFNDHYTNTSDALANRAHAHVWAHGGRTAWVKMNQMGGHDRDLGLVLTQGSLGGYSIEGRDATTLSNTRGAFLLHPTVLRLDPGQESVLEWTLFWHKGWENFFQQCQDLSEQFVRFNVSKYTVMPGENSVIQLSGARVDTKTTINKTPVHCNSTGNETACSFKFKTNQLGKQTLVVSTISADNVPWNSTIFLNSVPTRQDLLSKRATFITQRQQVNAPNSSLSGAFLLYDNQMEGQVLFDTRSDRNAGRERVGMGIFLARWLHRNNSSTVSDSFIKYYEYVCTQLQDATGYVLNGPGNRSKRLYNWPWVMQLHVKTAALNLGVLNSNGGPKPLDRFMLTLESFYAEGGADLYAIGLPILEGLDALKRSGNNTAYMRARFLFEEHGQYILNRGLDYPAFEVNFEQSIVAPAAITLLELYRHTNATKWLEGAELQLETLLRFAGKQPDYRLHDISIRHWDGYWFGKDRMWGDVFPHHWSALNAIALHHHARSIAPRDASLSTLETNAAEGIIRSNLALFDKDGRGSCAWIYPTSVNQRPGHYADPYANDQDWALSHLLQIEEDTISL